MNMNHLKNQFSECQSECRIETPKGEITRSIDLVNRDLSELDHVLEEIDHLVSFPHPVQCCNMDQSELPTATVSHRILEVHERLVDLVNKASQIREALNSQLDAELRLV